MIATFDALSSQLLSTSISSAAVALGVWLACRWLPGLPAAARATLWWLVALKLLVGLAWVSPIALPVLPASPRAATALLTSTSAVATTSDVAVQTGRAAGLAPESPSEPPISWRSVLVIGWLTGLAALVARFLWQLRQSRLVLSRAVAADARLGDLARGAARRLGLSRVPELCVSDDIDAPMLVGLRRPRIVVPGRFAALSVEEQRMALAHELAHQRRGDLWFGLIPALAERVFFFHPLARFAAREYLLAREAACDAEVVEALDVSAQDYGRLLLALGVAPVQAKFSAAGSSRTFSSLKRRLAMLGLPSPTRTVRTAGWAFAALAVCSLVPIRLVGRAVDDRVQIGRSADIAFPAPGIGTLGAAAPTPAQSPEKPVVVRDRDRLEYALILDERSTIMSGDFDSGQLATLRGASARLLWFRLGARQYVVRDDAAIGRAEEITRPLREIGAAQGEVGSRQGLIGAKQGEVGARQSAIGAKQGAVGARQSEIGAKQAALAARERDASDSQRQQLDRQREALDSQMRKLDDEMRALDDQMREADRPMADLDAQMRVLDDEMRGLDAKMHEAEPKVQSELRALFERLIAEKTAEPVK